MYLISSPSLCFSECLTISSDEEVTQPPPETNRQVIMRDPAITDSTRLKEPIITDEHESEKENITQGVKGNIFSPKVHV